MIEPVSQNTSGPGSASRHTEDDVFVFPASYGQRRLWFLDQFEPGSPYYNIPLVFRLTGTFRCDVFQDAVREIVRRHESLRTTFTAVDGQPMQVVSPGSDVVVPLVDLTGTSPKIRESEMLALARQEARTPFDLTTGPLFRAQVVRMDTHDHVVLITMHHIISDGWSVGVLVGEITALYAAFLKGVPSPLPDLPIQYPDYAQWQREWLQGEVLQRQIDYWKRQLQEAPEVIELPTDRPRPTVYTNVGATESTQYSPELTAALNRLSRQEGVTIFMTLLAAFQALLHRYTAQQENCVGTPIANRTQAELEGLIGLFINTVVIRTGFEGDPTFRQLLKRVKETTLAAYSHQDLPFEMLLDAMQLDRDMSHTPLFQVMFILQNAPAKVQVLPEMQLTQIDVEMGTATFDMTMTVAESVAGLDVSIEYNTDLFDASTIRRILRHYGNLLESVVREPDGRVSHLGILSQAERKQILEEWNAVVVPIPGTCAHHLIEEEARRVPEAVAVVCSGERLRYRELNARANQLARHLMRIGVTTEVRVGICMEKSVALATAVLAVMKSGGAYVPLDPAQPRERLASMMEDAEIPVLLTMREMLESLPPSAGRVLCLDRDAELWRTEPTEDVDAPVCPENLAYMIYTSGTTGKSKGTMVTHCSLVNAYLGWEEAYTLRSLARAHLQMANFAFDVFSGDYVRALCSGGKMVMVPRDILLDAPRLYELMVSEGVTVAEFVPAVLRNLVQYLEVTGQRLDFMRVLIAGSDIWYVSEYKKFLAYIGPETRLINSFGLTEATIDSSFFEAAELALPAERLVPIGHPFPNTQIYILNASFEPTPIGVAGEVFIGGEGLARGYHRRQDLTAEKFVPDRFARVPGARLYRTGDLARYLPDGNVEFLGRLDHQVKVRGFRVELGEIETAIRKHPKVKEGVVVVREDAPGDNRLVAYLVPADSEELSVGDVRRFLLEKVPDYMVPTAFVVLEELPLTPNGKVDRKALPVPDQESRDVGEAYVAPRTPTEEALVEVWKGVLEVEKVGVHDNFFLMGGHSLLATKLVSRIREALHVEVPLRKVFETPTVAALAAAVESARLQSAVPEAPPIRPVVRTPEMPLSFAQQRLWFLDQLEPNSPFYNLPEAYRIRGPLSVAILERCFNEVVRRHENLRSRLRTADGRPVQEFLPEIVVSLPTVDLSHRTHEERERAVQRHAKESAQRPIPLDDAPLFRVSLLRLDREEHVILLVMHHIISDDWSTTVLLREIAVLYEAFLHGRPSPLPELPVQYADFASWQRNWLQGEVLQEQIDYWRQQLGSARQVVDLPTDRPRPAVQTFRGSYATFMLGADLSAAIRDLCNKEGVTTFMGLMAAFQALLCRWTGQEDITVGTPIANRNRGEIEGLIGFFVNTLVLRTTLAGPTTFRQLLHNVRETALGAYAHQDVPFEMVVDALQPERDLSHSPLFQVMFVLQNAAARRQGVETGDVVISPVEAHSGTSKFDLTLFMLEDDVNFGGAWEYNTDLFDATTIERIITHFQTLLEGFVRNPDQPLGTVPMMTAVERRQVVADWNATNTVVPQDACVHHLFEFQAERFPDAVALRAGAERVTYGELNARANRLAHRLRSAGVGPEALVAVCMERTPELVVTLLGILKAGGAYLPLDPVYPEERLRFMIEDSGARFLMTHERLSDRIHATDHLTVMRVDGDAGRTDGGDAGTPSSGVCADNLAYVIYTSGSTGRPKGVLLHHRGVVNYLTWCRQAYPLDGGNGSPVHSSIAFDLTVTSVFAPLVTGRTVHLIPEEEGIDGLLGTLRSVGNFSLVKITPAHLDILRSQLRPDEASQLTRAFIIGGENLRGESVRFWQEHAPGTALVNEYGPTETVVGCCVYTVPAGDRNPGSVPIGRPIINTQMYVLDDVLEPVPIGVIGELAIGGAGVGRGYHARQELTAERFVPDPFGTVPGARLYRTGDRARFRQDGTIEFLGRTDEQVKIRGFRIELGEIEAVLSTHPALQDCVVIAREDVAGDRRLVAYVVPREDRTVETDEIRSYLSLQLPDYMVPSTILQLVTLPLTPNGKVDRKALPKPDAGLLSSVAVFASPRTPEEEVVAEIFRDLLGAERVGVFDDFFRAGGHSLLATQVVSRIRSAFGVELPLRSVFESPTVAALAQRVVAARQESTGASTPSIVPVPRTGDLPLSFGQQRLWFLDQLEPGNALYNIPAAVRLKGVLHLDALEWSLNEVIRRHEVLRTSFATRGGSPRQVISEELLLPVEFHDLREMPEADRERIALEKARAEFGRPFDLARGPLLRCCVLKLDEADHLLVLTMHHIVSDDWSTGLLVEEVAVLYEAFLKGRPSPLSPLPVQYADVASWQRQWLSGATLASQIDYWAERLRAAPPVLELPTDRPRPATPTWRGAMVNFELSAEEGRAMRALSTGEGATLYMGLLGLFQILLARYSGQDDISVGTPIANRGRVEIERLIGFFVNTVVMRTDLRGTPDFREVLRRVRDTALGAYAHQDLPFEMVVDALQPERDTSHSPLFQVMFVHQAARKQVQQIPGLALLPVEADTAAARFDLTLSVVEDGDTIRGAIEYSTDLFDADTIQRMARHYQTLARSVLADPETPFWRLPMMESQERWEVLCRWNATNAPFPSDRCAHELVEEQAARVPNAPAVVFGAETLSYRDLDCRANQLARYLLAGGRRRGERIGICMDRSIEMVVALLGVLKAGMAYVPFDHSHPRERIGYALHDAGVGLLLTQAALAEEFSFEGIETVALDTMHERITMMESGKTGIAVTPDDLAYVIYTSGSTGEPKGVLLAHRGLCNLVSAQTRGFGVSEGARVLQFASPGFDASVSEVFMALCTGATLCIAKKETLASPSDLAVYVRDARISVVTLPPTMLRALSPAEIPGVEILISAGESCPAELAQRWSAGRAFFNAYGPTETTVGPTYYRVQEGNENARWVPIGYPIGNTRVVLLDGALGPVPLGVHGEIYIGGPGVAWGYLNRPDLTAEKFVPDPFGDEPGGRLYRTGDVGFRRRDGAIVFVGRADDQVKIRGYRIELGEVESLLERHPAIRNAVVVTRGAQEADVRMVAYVVPASAEGNDPLLLRTHLREHIPEYMIPSAFVFLEAMPLSASGKVDKKSLPAPDFSGGVSGVGYVQPRTPDEEVLLAIWQRLLEVEKIGVYDSFFDRGGHSLLATQMVSRVREAFRVEIPLRQVFETPTIAGLAMAIAEARLAAEGIDFLPLARVPREGDVPLSFAQLRLWFLDQLEPNTPLYNIPLAVRLNGTLDVPILERSMNEIIRRHDVLRTTFVAREGRAVQVIAPELRIRIPVLDLSAVSAQEQIERALMHVTDEAQRPFDLTTGPLIRGLLIKLADEDHVAILTMHHITSDGWSMGVLLRELGILYGAFVRGEPSPLQELSLQYADFAHWQREWLQGVVLQEQIAYWEKQLAGLPPILELPTDHARPPVQTFRGRTIGFEVDEAIAQKLRSVGREVGATLFMTLLASFNVLLHRYSRQDDISVGTPAANRGRADIEGIIGFFVNTLVMRTDVTGDPSFRELVRRVRDVALGAYAHQDLPFEMLVDMLQPERTMNHTPLFQVMFVLQNAPMKAQELPGLTISPVEAETGIAKFDLTLALTETDQGLGGSLEYNADLFEHGTVERMARHFQQLLASIAASPDLPVSDLVIIPDEERRRLLHEWNAPSQAPLPEECIHELFTRQALRSPAAAAIVCEAESLPYGELNKRANRLAHLLQGRGVGPDTLVGVYMERSIDMVVAIIGILKAGGAYLPIDPVYPAERLLFMMDDARAPVLLTEERMLGNLEGLRAEIICLDRDRHIIEQEAAEEPHCRATCDHLAYVIYTSGSTGKPKGVMVTHRNVTRLFTATDEWYRFTQEDVWTFYHSHAFDFSVWEIWGALLYGGRLVVVPYIVSRSPEAFYELLCAEGVTVLNQTPSAFRQLLRVEDQNGVADGLGLRLVIFGGEALELQSLRPWFERHGDRQPQLVNMYGITETSVHVTYRPIGLSDLTSAPGSVIGVRIPDLRLYILDEHMQPAPIGVPAELYVAGEGVSRGYLNRPELTGDRFVPDPFGTMPGARLYKTGDLGRYLADGDVEYLGRMDHQVKIRGFRIELGEVEAVLAQHPSLREVFTLVREDEPGNKRLVAYMVLSEGSAPTVTELRAFVQQKLPEYMVPAAFVFLPALPLTPNGKVDRRALPAPEEVRAELGSDYVAPRTREEEILARVFQEILSVERVGINDNFFALGGDSILSIQVVAHARQAGVAITPRQLFECPTVQLLAEVARTGVQDVAEDGPASGPVPLTPVQRWFFEHHREQPGHFNTSMLLEVQGQLDLDILERAFDHLLGHHDALRLTFTEVNGEWTQRYAAWPVRLTISRHDFSAAKRRDHRRLIEGLASEVQGSFDLSQAPLVRVAFMSLGADLPGRLLIVFHHLVVDGVSLRMLMEDLQNLYLQLLNGEEPVLPPKTLSYGAWATRLRQYAESENLREELEYWRGIVRAGATSLPADFPDGENTYGSTENITVSLGSADTLMLLRDVPRVLNVHMNTILLTALARTMRSWTDSPRLLVEMEGHGREDLEEDVDLSRTVGWFTSIFPVQVDIGGSGRIEEELTRVKQQLQAMPRRGVGYGLLRYLSADPAIREAMSAMPSPAVNFNYLGQFDQAAGGGMLPLAMARESAGPEQAPNGRRSAQLYVVGIVSGGDFAVRWLYSQRLHKRSTVAALAKTYMKELRALIQHARAAVR